MRTRVRLLAAVLAVAALTATSCSSPPSSGTRQATSNGAELPKCPLDALKSAKGKVKVVIWHALSAESKKALDEIAASYNASQDKVEVTPQVQGKSYAEVLRKYQSAIPTKQLPQAAYMEDTSLQTMIDSGTVFPAQACMDVPGQFNINDIRPAVRGYYTIDNVYWPSFANLSGPILYYNQSHFKKAGLDPLTPPQTLDEVRADAVKLKAAGIDKPLAFLDNPWFFECWLLGLGQNLVNKNDGRSGTPTEATFDTPEAADLLSFLQKMKDDGLLQPISVTDGGIDQYLAVAQQKSSMLIETSTAATTIKAFLGGTLNPADAGIEANIPTEGITPAAGPFPGVDAGGLVRASGGAFYMTNTSSPAEIAATWDFMRYMLQTPQSVKWHVQGSYLPSLKSVQRDPAVTAFDKDDLAGQLLAVADDQVDNIDPLAPGAAIGPYPEFVNILKNMMDEVMIKGADPKTALASAKKEADATLKNYNG